MPMREADARWEGNLREGEGSIRLGTGAFEERYSFGSRFEDAAGTNPEELIAAAHAGCFSMALASGLSKAGFEPEMVRTRAIVQIDPRDGGFAIDRIRLVSQAEVPGIDPSTFEKIAEDAKDTCPVSQALASVPIELEAAVRA